MDAGEDKKVSREEFTSETVRNKLETVITDYFKPQFLYQKHKYKSLLVRIFTTSLRR